MFGVQVGESGIEYLALYTTAHVEHIKIRREENSRANFEAIEAMKGKLRGRDMKRECLRYLEEPKRLETGVLKSSPCYYNLKAMPSCPLKYTFHNTRTKVEVVPNIIQRKTMHASRTFDQVITLILEYVTDLQATESILEFRLEEDFQLLESFDNDIFYTVGDKLYKREFGMQRQMPLQNKIGKPVSISVSADGDTLAINCEGDQTYTVNEGRIKEQHASFGIVSSDGKAIILERFGRSFDDDTSSLTFLTAFGLLAIFNFVMHPLTGLLLFCLLAMRGFYEASKSSVPQSTTAEKDSPLTVLSDLNGGVLSTWKDHKLRSASPDFESIVLTSVRDKRSMVVSRFPGYTLKDNPKLPQWSDTIFLKLEMDVILGAPFILDVKNILAVYSFRGELEFQNGVLYANFGIPLMATFDELLDYPGIHQVKRYGVKTILIHKRNGKKQVQLRIRLPGHRELAEVLHKFLSS